MYLTFSVYLSFAVYRRMRKKRSGELIPFKLFHSNYLVDRLYKRFPELGLLEIRGVISPWSFPRKAWQLPPFGFTSLFDIVEGGVCHSAGSAHTCVESRMSRWVLGSETPHRRNDQLGHLKKYKKRVCNGFFFFFFLIDVID